MYLSELATQVSEIEGTGLAMAYYAQYTVSMDEHIVSAYHRRLYGAHSTPLYFPQKRHVASLRRVQKNC